MRIIDRHILKSLILNFLGSLFVFLFLYIIVDLFGRLDEILKNKVPIFVLRDYYLTFLPVVFNRTAPVASLLACLYTLGKLNRNNEILALRASGVSILQIAGPIILFGLVLSIFVFFINERFTPSTQRKNQEIKRGYFSKGRPQESIKNLAFLGEDSLCFIQNFYPDKNRIEGITILEHDKDLDLTAKITAEKGIFQKDFWIFYKSLRYNFSKDGKILGKPIFFDEEISDFKEIPQNLLKKKISPEFMNTKDLSLHIKRLTKARAETVVRSFKVDFYDKISSPFSSLVIIFIGIPFGLSIRKKRIEFFSFGVCIILGFLYYVIWSISINLGKIGIFPPLLSACFTHLLFLSSSLYFTSKLT